MNVKNGIRGYETVVEHGDLESWRKKIGERVSAAIRTNPDEIVRRKELAKTTIGAWARSDEGRRKSSETAKVVSLRPEIMRSRSKNLKRWRDDNPEDFYQKSIVAMHNAFHSKPQQRLFELCKKMDNGFEQNQLLWNAAFTTITKRRQIDILHREKKIIVEFDGPYHFKHLKEGDNVEMVKQKDHELNEVAVSLGYTVIRISYDQYSYRGGGTFADVVLGTIDGLVLCPESGLYRMGAAYDA